MTTASRRRGPAPRYTREQLVDAAVAVVEAQGFAALSLRSVARHLGVGPMTLYTYVDSSEELAALVVDRLVAETVRGIRWPRTWRGVLRLFAKKLDALVVAHPAMVEAYGRGMVRSSAADQVARDVMGRLVADGLTPSQAQQAYVGVHAVVLGYALMRSGFEHLGAAGQPGAKGRPEGARGVQLTALVDAFLDGVAL